ncbi:MAG: sensor histidine kinase [Flavicella sp.]
MIFLILLTYVLIAFITIRQYHQQTSKYNSGRFERKERATRLNISHVLGNASTPLNSEKLLQVFSKKIFQISEVHKLNITIYNLNGTHILSSDSLSQTKDIISSTTLNRLKNQHDKRLLAATKDEGNQLQSSYTYLYANDKIPIGVLKLYYLQDNSEQDKNLKEFLIRMAVVYLLMFVIAIVIAYFLSSYITHSLKTIIDKIDKTGLNTKNEKIFMENTSVEIQKLVSSYNNMIDQLEESASKLAASEREQAWRDMAKQVAHEIKNPLTPMRLSVQSFERRFNADDPEIKNKLKEYSETLIQQIDIMSSIASAFSNFAQMPVQKKEHIELVAVLKMALDIFSENAINFTSDVKEAWLYLDKNQLIRVVTNIVKNAIQATKELEKQVIDVSLLDEKASFVILVSDNGIGIEESLKPYIFEPRFTTKTSGMGLGLAMSQKIIEAYGGSITFVSKMGEGTTFTVRIPKS